jgi:hypothetical protein
MRVGFILFLCSYQIHLINSFQNLIFLTFLVKYSVSKLGNKAWETQNICICAMPYSVLPQLPLSGNLLVYIPYLSSLNKKFLPEFLRLPRACDKFPDYFHAFPLEPWLSRLKASWPISLLSVPCISNHLLHFWCVPKCSHIPLSEFQISAESTDHLF